MHSSSANQRKTQTTLHQGGFCHTIFRTILHENLYVSTFDHLQVGQKVDQGYVLKVDCDENKEVLEDAVCQDGEWSVKVECVNSTSEAYACWLCHMEFRSFLCEYFKMWNLLYRALQQGQASRTSRWLLQVAKVYNTTEELNLLCFQVS